MSDARQTNPVLPAAAGAGLGDTVNAGHPEVGENDGRLRVPKDLEGLKTVFGGQHLEPAVGQIDPEHLADAFFIVGQQKLLVHGGFPVRGGR